MTTFTIMIDKTIRFDNYDKFVNVYFETKTIDNSFR